MPLSDTAVVFSSVLEDPILELDNVRLCRLGTFFTLRYELLVCRGLKHDDAMDSKDNSMSERGVKCLICRVQNYF